MVGQVEIPSPLLATELWEVERCSFSETLSDVQAGDCLLPWALPAVRLPTCSAPGPWCSDWDDKSCIQSLLSEP